MFFKAKKPLNAILLVKCYSLLSSDLRIIIIENTLKLREYQLKLLEMFKYVLSTHKECHTGDPYLECLSPS